MFNISKKLNTVESPQDDVFTVFKKAVNNGQTRLALESLIEVIDAIVAFIDKPVLEEKSVESSVSKKKNKESLIEATS